MEKNRENPQCKLNENAVAFQSRFSIVGIPEDIFFLFLMILIKTNINTKLSTYKAYARFFFVNTIAWKINYGKSGIYSVNRAGRICWYFFMNKYGFKHTVK